MYARNRMKQFDVLKYWVSLYSEMTGIKIPTATMGLRAKVAFNKRVSIFKDAVNFTDQDVKMLMLYCLNHNPSNIDAISYGDITNVFKTTAKFNKWKKDNYDVINEVGMPRAILFTRPDYAPNNEFDSFAEAYS